MPVHQKKIIDGKVIIERPRAKPEDCILTEGLHKAIIDNDTWDLAQKYLSTNSTRPVPLSKQIKNPLAGLIICGACGRRMVRRPYTLKKYPDTIMCPSTACPNISSQLSYVEKRLLQALEKWLEEYKLNWTTNSDENDNKIIQLDVKKKAVKNLNNELKVLEKQMENIHDLLEQGIYSTETFLERSRIINKKIESTQKDIKTLQNDVHSNEIKETNQKIIIPRVEKVLELYKVTDDPALKNELLKEVIEKAVYTKTIKGSKKDSKPDDFELVLYPKLP